MNEHGKRLSQMSEAKLELVARELIRLQADSKRSAEPIAVVGIGCRFPGGVTDSSSFWSLLESGRDARSPAPAERGWGGKAPLGYFIQDPFRFDAALFGMSPREARSIDPQQRLLLEVVWQALEDAGYAPRSLDGVRAGVYIGAYADDYAHQLIWSGDVDGVDGYTSTGTSHGVSVGRVAHVFGLRGPVMAVDTACSSSLVAVHLACAALRANECEMSLVGGVSLALSAQAPFTLQRARMLASDGRCKTFSASADGYGRGEGCGVVVLRRLSDALAAKQRVLATIRASAVNHDGRASSLTAPNGAAQVDVISRALQAAGLEPSAVDAVECHGTGTPLGDPVEVRALREIFGGARGPEHLLRLSAVKSNLGHLEAAAGIAGLIKMVLALEHRQLPASLHVDALNPELASDSSWMKVTREPEAWQRGDGPRVAGVSSFGFGGTNAHVLLEQAPTLDARADADHGAGRILALSGATDDGLRALARGVADQLAQRTPALSDLCLTANVGRTAHRHRAVLAAESVEQLSDQLTALATGLPHPGLRQTLTPAAAPQVVFMFAGQGAQFAGMGRQLFERLPSFKRDLLTCEEILSESLGWRLTALLYGDQQHLLNDTTYAQPVLFAFEYALANVWLSSGVQPTAFLGHSVGEYVAAHFAGVFDLETGLRVIAERGRLMGALPSGGAMLAILAEPAWVQAKLERHPGLEIAALNAPGNVVVSGGEQAVIALRATAQAQGIRCHRLEVSHAFHSALMEPMLGAFERFVDRQTLHAPTQALLSNLSGGFADQRVASSAYWVDHLRRCVRFADDLRAVRERQIGILLEIGPSTTLSSIARQVLDAEVAVVPSLRAGRDDFAALNDACRALFLAGAGPSWSFLQETNARRCAFPAYPFGGEQHRHEATRKGEQRLAGKLQGVVTLPLLGEKHVVAGTDQAVYERELRVSESEIAVDHKLFGSVVVPGAYYVAMALAAAGRVWPDAPLRLTNAEFYAPLRLDEGRPQKIQTVLKTGRDDVHVTIHAAPDGSDDFVCHARLNVAPGSASHGVAQKAHGAGKPLAGFYEQMSAAGFGLGPRFRWLAGLQVEHGGAFAELRQPGDATGPFHEHPGFIDSCFQLLAAAARDLELSSHRELFVPVGVDAIELHRLDATRLVVAARLDAARSTAHTVIGDVDVQDEQGRPYLTIRGLCARRMPRAAFDAQAASGSEVLRTAWQDLPAADTIRLRCAAVGATVAETQQLGAALAAVGGELRAWPGAPHAELPELDQLLLFVPALSGLDAEQRRHDALELLLDSVRLLVNAAGARPRLRVITRNGQPLDARDALDEGAHAFAGLLRSMAFEHPELRPGLLDLESGAEVSTHFVQALGIEGETVLALRRARCYAPRLEVQGALSTSRPFVRTGGSYLITGGLGGLGQYTARWLLDQGAERVVLLGRRPLSPPLAAELDALAATYAGRVEYATADVANRAELTRAIALASVPTLPWLGLVHAAGVLDDGVLLNQDAARFEATLAPKVRGTLNLLDELQGQDLDWWVFFSSMAATVGSPGQASYAYANGFLNGVASRLGADGAHAVSIAWGPVAEVGMAAQKSFERHDFVGRLDPKQIGAHIQAALGSCRDQVAIMRVDFAALAAVYPTPSYLERCIPAAREVTQSGISLRIDRESALSVAPELRVELLIRSLTEALSAIVELPPDQLSADQSLASIGLDSLTSLELKNAVEKALQVRLSISTLLRGPTLRELAQLVSQELALGDAQTAAASDSEFLEHLDDRQVAALLAHLSEEETHVAS